MKNDDVKAYIVNDRVFDKWIDKDEQDVGYFKGSVPHPTKSPQADRVDYIDIIPGGGIGMNYVATCDVRYGRYEKLVYILYDPHLNMFYDARGKRLSNVFELITPNDLMLFRHDPGNSLFPHRQKKNTMCEIVTEFTEYPCEFSDDRFNSDWLGDYALQNK